MESGEGTSVEVEDSNDSQEIDMDLDMAEAVMPSLVTPQDAVDYWNICLIKENLSCHHFRKWWRRKVPKVLSPTPTMDYQSPRAHIDEDEATRLLTDPLERFLCNGDPQEVLKKLSGLNDPPAQCGRIFKMGEPIYSCRDCGHDQACVLCVNCFKNSEHRFHRYKMSTSCGGGYCDCGDVEAWSDYVHCSKHNIGNRSQNNDPLSKLPPDVQIRARYVFTSVLKYINEMLTTETVLTLPADLTFKEDSEPSSNDPMDSLVGTQDQYSTVIYNDEVHTFDEVIQTLPRAVECDRNAAIGFATLIDREGRCLVKCSGFKVCSEVKRITQRITSRRGTKPLKVVIMHSYVVAHQIFAMRLLVWLQNILTHSVGFRSIFASIMLEKDAGERCSILEAICRHDTALWKQARNYMHHLLVSGMLLENESKRQFACVFTKCYGHMMKDFILDDHDHSFSLTAHAIQLFSVPSLAYYLIGKEDVLAILLRTFMSECERKRNDSGKLEFQRNLNTIGYRRSIFILHDLKYLLTTPPSPNDWDNDIRKGFLHGLSLLLEILSWMQGMDMQKRQTDHHVEYELEWESAFHLHMKLAPIFSLLLAWCGTDRVVFIKAMRMLFKKLAKEEPLCNTMVECEIAGHSANCIDYQVSSRPISIHLPLTRMLVGLSLHMEKFNLDFNANEFNIPEKPTPLAMMELSLRTLVLIAQVQAGMWRRNGYSLVDQLRAYHDPRCCKEMLDQDVAMLQLGATLIDPDEYVINLVNKFQLSNWSNREFDCAEDDSIRQVTTLVEEFFGTLIVIFGERYTPGVGQVTPEDAIRREIIQLLCVEPMSHSSLNKLLPEDINRETTMEKVIESVATFKKPTTGIGKGIYELKPEFYSEYNVFFYHYTREEQSRSEEAQRARKKASDEPQCNPPPKPPAFTKQFAPIADVMKCDSYIYLLSLVLERADNLKSRCFSENQVHRVLHLVGLSLHEEEREKQSQEYDAENTFTKRAEKFNFLDLMEQLVGSQRIESHKSLLNWTLKKWREISGKEDSIEVKKDEPEATKDDTHDEDSDVQKKKRAEIAAARRAKLMAQMKSAQKNFMKENAQLFDETSSSSSTSACQPKIKSEMMEVDEDQSPVCVGPYRSAPVISEMTFTCILCQEDEVLKAEGPSLVMAAFVQKSTVLCKRHRVPGDDISVLPRQYQKFPILPADLAVAPHTSSCGHIMHSTCWQKYYDDIVRHERHRSRMRHPQSFDIEKEEFLCPLCRCLSNAVIPLIPQFHLLQPCTSSGNASNPQIKLHLSEWLRALLTALKYKKELSPSKVPPKGADETGGEGEGGRGGDSSPEDQKRSTVTRYYTCPLDQVVQELEQMNCDGKSFARLFTDQEGSELQFSNSMFEMMNLFSQATYRIGLNVLPNQYDERIPLMVWQSCAFTIHSIVWSILDQGKSLFGFTSSRQSDCLSTLVRFCGIVGSNFGEPKVIRSHSLKLLSILLEVREENLSILEFDAFGLLVALTFSLPSLFNGDQAAPLPSSNVQDLVSLHLLFVLHLAQILMTTKKFSPLIRARKMQNDEEELVAPILDLLHSVGGSQEEEGNGSQVLSPEDVWSDVKKASLPFLRCCALFYHHLSSIPAPTELQSVIADPNEEFNHLVKYLGLPSAPAKLLESHDLMSLAKKWASHPNVTRHRTPVSYPIRINSLIELPTDYSELINSISSFTCPKSMSDDSRVPAMCLICGHVMCSQSYCCQTTIDDARVGACTAHAQCCGAGNGIFLRVRECKVVLVSGRSKGCFISPPYLDQYGETDTGLRRGNPLTLCPERYRKIHRLWLNHGIPEEIAHNLESNQFLITTPWQHL